jgi:acetoin utilization protein AcuB
LHRLAGMRHPIREHMTPAPHSIGSTQTLAVAHRLMNSHHLRHLPVLDAGKIVGVISQRDLYFIETLRDVDPEETSVADAMTQDVYAVSPSTPLEEVVQTMADRKLGCAVVVEKGKPVGLFTTTDALRELVKALS